MIRKNYLLQTIDLKIINNESRKKADEKIDGSKDEVHSSLAKDRAC